MIFLLVSCWLEMKILYSVLGIEMYGVSNLCKASESCFHCAPNHLWLILSSKTRASLKCPIQWVRKWTPNEKEKKCVRMLRSMKSIPVTNHRIKTEIQCHCNILFVNRVTQLNVIYGLRLFLFVSQKGQKRVENNNKIKQKRRKLWINCF